MSVVESKQNLIFDVGAHMGEDTAFYLKKGFRVIGIEADPVLAEQLRCRFKTDIDHSNLVIVESAIAPEAGTVRFYANDAHSFWGTTDPQWALRNQKLGAPSRTIEVRAERFQDILRRYGIPYYLKIDIEGADRLCLQALKDFDARPAYLSIESDKVSWAALKEEFQLLESLGYRSFQIINQAKMYRQVAPEPALEGRYVKLSEEEGHSGLFGRELPHAWLTKKEALRRYRWIFLLYRVFGDNTLGRRLLRHFPRLERILAPGWYDTHAAAQQ